MLKKILKVWEGGEWRYAEEGTRVRYPVNEETENHVAQIEWANGILSRENVTYPSGRQSHEVAAEVLEEREFYLMAFMGIVA